MDKKSESLKLHFFQEHIQSKGSIMKQVNRKFLSELEQTHVSSVHNNIKQLLDRGFKVSFDKETCEGVAKKSDLKINFQIGGENIYFDYSAYTKSGIECFIDQLLQLHRGLD